MPFKATQFNEVAVEIQHLQRQHLPRTMPEHVPSPSQAEHLVGVTALEANRLSAIPSLSVEIKSVRTQERTGG